MDNDKNYWSLGRLDAQIGEALRHEAITEQHAEKMRNVLELALKNAPPGSTMESLSVDFQAAQLFRELIYNERMEIDKLLPEIVLVDAHAN